MQTNSNSIIPDCKRVSASMQLGEYITSWT